MRYRRHKRFIPKEFGDFLSVLSFLGFLAIALKFLGNIAWLDEHLTDFFLVVIGLSFVVIGELFTIVRWAKNGVQGKEVSQLALIIIGVLSIVLGTLLMLGVAIPEIFFGIIGILAVISGLFILFDYIAKNK